MQTQTHTAQSKHRHRISWLYLWGKSTHLLPIICQTKSQSSVSDGFPSSFSYWKQLNITTHKHTQRGHVQVFSSQLSVGQPDSRAWLEGFATGSWIFCGRGACVCVCECVCRRVFSLPDLLSQGVWARSVPSLPSSFTHVCVCSPMHTHTGACPHMCAVCRMSVRVCVCVVWRVIHGARGGWGGDVAVGGCGACAPNPSLENLAFLHLSSPTQYPEWCSILTTAWLHQNHLCVFLICF